MQRRQGHCRRPPFPEAGVTSRSRTGGGVAAVGVRGASVRTSRAPGRRALPQRRRSPGQGRAPAEGHASAGDIAEAWWTPGSPGGGRANPEAAAEASPLDHQSSGIAVPDRSAAPRGRDAAGAPRRGRSGSPGRRAAPRGRPRSRPGRCPSSSRARALAGSSFRACSKRRRAPSTSPLILSQRPASMSWLASPVHCGLAPRRSSTPTKRTRVRSSWSTQSESAVQIFALASRRGRS